LSVRNYLRLRYFTHFSKPAGDRRIYRTIYQQNSRTILELGIGNVQRAQRMIEVAALQRSIQDIHYIGVDLFEARTTADGSGVPLKTAHRLLQATGARVRLWPGDPLRALSQAANTLRGVDLFVISARLDTESLAQAWFYVPRMLHPRSLVLLADQTDPEQFRFVSMTQIETLAVAALRCRVA
jgi:hypothetical protein